MRIRTQIHILLGTLWLGGTLVFAASLASADFLDLGELPGGDFFVSQALSVSGDGRVVVGSGSTVSGASEEGGPIVHEQAIRWEAGILVGINSLGTSYRRTIALGVSYDGSVVTGIMDDPSDFRGFIWDEAGVAPLGDLPGGPTGSKGDAVSDDGTAIAGTGYDAVNERAIRWDAGVITNLGIGSGWSTAIGISGDGATLVGYDEFEGAVRWDGTEMTPLAKPPGDFRTRAYGISSDGSTIVGSSLQSAGETAIRWVNGAPELLGVLAGSETSVALDASGDGSIVVGYCASLNLPKRAFIWDSENGMRDLQEVLIDRGEDLTGWELREAAGISDDGLVIVGTGINPESRPRGWVTAPVLPTPTPTPTPTPVPTPTPTPVPEPGQWLQLVSGLLGLGMLGKGRRVSHQGSISPHQESGRGWRCAKSPTALAKLWWS